jgi:hypothetical protein
VLVIIGLLIGGILVGMDLIKTARLRAYISQLQNYNSAVNSFKLKYNCIPGDCSSASSYSLGSNGNGNGIITGVITEPSWSVADYNINLSDSNSSVYLGCCGGTEANNVWLHLRGANMIPEYTPTLGVSDGAGESYSIPPSKHDGTSMVLVGWKGKHYYKSGSLNARNSGNLLWSDNFSPAEAAYVFEKMGGMTTPTTVPCANSGVCPEALGKERVIVSSVNGCSWVGFGCNRFYRIQTQGAGGANADYCINTSVSPAWFNLTNTKKLCQLIIQADF